MADHCIEAARGFQSSRRGDALQIDSDIHTRRGRWLNAAELLLPPETDISLLRRKFHIVAKTFYRSDQRLVNRTKRRLRAGVLGRDEIIAFKLRGAGTQCLMGDQVGITMRQAAFCLEEFDDLAMFDEFAGARDPKPFGKGLAGLLL